jgi:hypothetical protein
MDLQPGDKLGLYEIVSPIGKGPMGEVWRACDGQFPINTELHDRVAHPPAAELEASE